MTRRALKTTTASILALSLIQPYPAMAQIRAVNPQIAQHSSAQTGAERLFLAQAEVPTCFTNGEVDTARCDIDMLRAELEALLQNGLAEDRPAEDEATAALSADERIGLLSAAIEGAEREAAIEAERIAAAEAEATAAAEAEAAARAEAEVAAAAQAEAEAAALAEAEAAAAAEAEAAVAAEAEAEAAARAAAEEAAVAAAAAEETAATEAARVAQAEAEAEDAVAAEAEATAEVEAATPAEGDASAEADALREALAAAEAETAAPAEEAPAEEAPVAADAETPAEQAPVAQTAEAEAPAEEAPVEATSTPQAETLVTTEEEAEASELKDAEILAEQEAAQTLGAVASAVADETVADTAGAADSAAPDAAPAPAAEVTTEVVTAQDVRSSDQEFTAPAITSADAPRAESSGLSNLEKAGLLALGALAVGAIMSNGQRVAATSGDRVIVEDNSGRFQVLKDDDALIRRPGSTVETRRFDDGSSTTTTTREDGSRVVTIRDASGRVLRRSVFDLSGRETLLIDDIATVEPVNVSTLPPAPRVNFGATDRDALAAALREAELRDLGRTFSLRQVREIVEVRELAPQISIEDVTFRTGSAAIEPSEAEQLREIGNLMRQMIRDNPREIFLVEGYTDAVGGAAFNLLLSDRRAESVALALTEYFDVPPENMVVQGFGERFLKIPTLEGERQNRRVAVRRITDLIALR